MIRYTRVATLLLALALSGSAPAPPVPDPVDRLAGLGQVWGFLKYYHPGVAAGTIDWDSALVAAVPTVERARTSADFNRAITALIESAGPVTPCADCPHAYPDDLLVNLDLRFIENAALFTPDVSARLEWIRDNRHQGPGRYIAYAPGAGTADFSADTAYSRPAHPDTPQRLLALFRYWNAVHYFFPYKYINDGDWNDVLREFVPRMIAAADSAAYHLAVLELTTRVRDTHVVTLSDVLHEVLGPRTPAFDARSIENHVVVWRRAPDARADGSGLLVNDIITHIDGVPIAERRAQLARYVAAGNPATFERNLVRLVLRGHGDSVTYSVVRDGRSLQRRVAMAPYAPPAEPGAARPTPAYPVTELVRVLPGNIGYVNMGDIERAQVDSAVAILRTTSGIIMDVRNYPRGTMFSFAAFLNPEPRPFAMFTAPDPGFPGALTRTPPIAAGPSVPNPEAYAGRVAILADERSQSHSEFSIMALQTASENKVIGSQTAGADGNIVRITLPGGIRTWFTGLGVYYPDGRQTQRIGIVPDIEIRATLAGVLAGRDEVLERATEYVLTGR